MKALTRDRNSHLKSGNASVAMLLVIQWLSAILGVGLSVYLSILHADLASGNAQFSPLCMLGPYANCAVVNTSRFSEVGGWPTAAFGILGYGFALILALASRLAVRRWHLFQTTLFVFGSLAVLVDVLLLFYQIFSLHTVCLFCAATYLATGGLFMTSFRLRKTPPEPGHQSTFFSFLKVSALILLTLSVLGGVASLALGLPQRLHPSLAPGTQPLLVDDFFTHWNDLQVYSVPVNPAVDPVWGNPRAPLKVVVFSDFECPHCRHGAQVIQEAFAATPDKVAVFFKNFPLSSLCNSKLTNPMHRRACQLALDAVCAQQLGKFWELHDTLFFKWNPDPSRDPEPFVESILPSKEVAQCLSSESATEKRKQDIQLGQNLPIDGTPTLFVNGRKWTIPLTVENLRHLLALSHP